MTIIHNATFMIECALEQEFIRWFDEQLPRLGILSSPRLSAMREAGGIDYTHAEAQSVAFQCEFDSIEDAMRWRNGPLAEVAADFMTKFAPNAMVFTSIFEQIPL